MPNQKYEEQYKRNETLYKMVATVTSSFCHIKESKWPLSVRPEISLKTRVEQDWPRSRSKRQDQQQTSPTACGCSAPWYVHVVYQGGHSCVVNMISLLFVGQRSPRASCVCVCFSADPRHTDVCNESKLIRSLFLSSVPSECAQEPSLTQEAT